MCTFETFKAVARTTLISVHNRDNSHYLMEQHGNLTELYTTLQCDTNQLNQACILLDMVGKRVYAAIISPDDVTIDHQTPPHH